MTEKKEEVVNDRILKNGVSWDIKSIFRHEWIRTAAFIITTHEALMINLVSLEIVHGSYMGVLVVDDVIVVMMCVSVPDVSMAGIAKEIGMVV